MEPPEKPSEADCCNSGCNPCIFDVYEDQLAKYKKRLQTANADVPKNCMKPLKYTRFKLTQSIISTRNANVYIFECIDAQTESRLIFKPGQHFLMKASLYGEEFTRAYSPIPWKCLNNKSFAVLIKLYELGKMSRVLSKLEVGAEALWRGPYGDFQISYQCKNILFVAQGTGIAPIYAIINEMVEDEECDTILKLFYCCRIDDIYLRDELYALCRFWNFSYELFLGNGAVTCAKYNEIVNSDKLDEKVIKGFLEKAQDLRVVVCGSEEFSICMKSMFINHGFNKEHLFII